MAKVDATTDEDIARQIAEDPDTAPELTEEWFDQAEVWHGNRYLGHGRDFENGKRKVGRPKGSGKKELVTIRLDRDVLDRFRAGGPGWQTRLNDALRAATPTSARRRVRAQLEAHGAEGVSAEKLRAEIKEDFPMARPAQPSQSVVQSGRLDSLSQGPQLAAATFARLPKQIGEQKTGQARETLKRITGTKPSAKGTPA